jgi:hypothetical protein
VPAVLLPLEFESVAALPTPIDFRRGIHSSFGVISAAFAEIFRKNPASGLGLWQHCEKEAD